MLIKLKNWHFLIIRDAFVCAGPVSKNCILGYPMRLRGKRWFPDGRSVRCYNCRAEADNLSEIFGKLLLVVNSSAVATKYYCYDAMML